MQSTSNQLDNWRQHAASRWQLRIWVGILHSRMHDYPLIFIRKSRHNRTSCWKKEKKQSRILRLLQNIGVRYQVERIAFTYQVDQNRIGDTFSKLDLAEINDNRVDQVPKTHNKRLHSIRFIVLILSHNCIRCWNPIEIG